MSNILLVENEYDWLNLIYQALTGHEVAQAQTYKETMELLAGRVTYHVAIVDLNLLTDNDGLGGELLEIMRKSYPSTRRIALTGEPPTSAKALFEQYDLYDLLLKKNMVLQVVRDVVRTAAEGVADNVPAETRIEQVEIRNAVLSWKSDTLLTLDQRIQTARDEISQAGRASEETQDSVYELRVLEARKEELEAACSAIIAQATGIQKEQDPARARREFERLQGRFRT
jgi:hypothetical protein